MINTNNTYLNNDPNSSIKLLKIIAWICLSFPSRKAEFNNFISHHNPDIIILNETKVKQVEGEKLLKLPGYITFLKSRNDSNRGGGCALLIRKIFNLLRLTNLIIEICTV